MSSFGFEFDDLAVSAKQREVFIELGDSKKKANVVRDKVVIPSVEIDEAAFDDFVIRVPTIVNKVVSQSIAAGTVVSEGTTIDLVLAPAVTIPGNIFTDGHLGLKDMLLAEVHEKFVLGNANVRTVLARRPDPDDLTNEDITFLATLAEQGGVAIAEQPGQSAKDFFVTLQIANTFLG